MMYRNFKNHRLIPVNCLLFISCLFVEKYFLLFPNCQLIRMSEILLFLQVTAKEVWFCACSFIFMSAKSLLLFKMFFFFFTFPVFTRVQTVHDLITESRIGSKTITIIAIYSLTNKHMSAVFSASEAFPVQQSKACRDIAGRWAPYWSTTIVIKTDEAAVN